MSEMMSGFQDAFISYGRADSKEFATKLYSNLVERGLRIWFDQNDIPLGVDFQNQIDDGLEKSDNFIFIIAPHSINSPYCGKEIELALRRNKRIIPLLHVEQITQEIWQKRNPTRELADWEAYQAKGLHSSFTNMHPAIGKINWVYFREGVDDFEKSLNGLLELCNRHKNYVHQHTYFLAKSLEWERNQKQASYLLVGDERIAAEKWLKIRFKDEQPPCIPTDLHCEFICESTKNANNLMTHVFLSYSDQERPVMEKIARVLRREGLTVWTNKTDIKTGSDFQEVINRGIEEADNLVFLISPSSLASEYCRRELTHAYLYSKRIVPLLVAQMDVEQIPAELRSLQFIDMTDHEDAAEYQIDTATLIRELREDEAYYEQHKILLAKALKWERQRQNPSILLRGYNLRQAVAWLKVAKNRDHHPAVPLQEQFINESLKQPPEATLDVFISYSQNDADFVRKLNDGLQVQGKTTWFDQEAIAAGTDFQQEVFNGIERCNHLLFVISPNSTQSPECANQIEYATKLNKRIITVLYQPVAPTDLPAAVATLQAIDFRRNGGDFFVNFGDLIRALDTDPEYLRTHTRLLLRAMEWEQEGRDDSYLLRGKELNTVEEWFQQSETMNPSPTELQVQYLAKSQELPKRRIKPRNVALTSLAATALVCVARFLGLMQPVELAAYDHLLRLRPSEPQDNRFLVVSVDESAVEFIDRSPRYRTGRGTLPDLALSDLLKNLNRHQPRLIGLDFHRDFVSHSELSATFEKTSNLIALCRGGGINELGEQDTGTKPPPNLSMEQVGFNNVVHDGGSFIRRQYLIAGADPEYCNTTEAFSLVLARKYLERAGKPFTSPYDPKEENFTRSMQFGSTTIPPLWGDGSGYRDRGVQLGGYQAMLNFRTHQGRLEKFVPMVSLTEMLENRVPAEMIRDRIVLIGYVDRVDRHAHYWDTPFGEVPGVILHAQMASQLISATLDNRRLIGWMPLWAETVWILGWSLVGGFVVWWFRRSQLLAIAIIVTVISVYSISYLALMTQSIWLPLAPALVAIGLAGGGVGYLTYRLRR